MHMQAGLVPSGIGFLRRGTWDAARFRAPLEVFLGDEGLFGTGL